MGVTPCRHLHYLLCHTPHLARILQTPYSYCGVSNLLTQRGRDWAHSRAVLAQVPTRVAVAIKQVPVKLAYGIRALADGDDNKDLLVGDVFPKAAAPQS